MEAFLAQKLLNWTTTQAATRCSEINEPHRGPGRSTLAIHSSRRIHLTLRSKTLLLTGLSASALCFGISEAHADSSVSVHVDGAVRVSAGAVHVNVDGALDAWARLEAGVALGVRFAEPPPPPPAPVVVVAGCEYRCSAVPSYYVEQETYDHQVQPVVVTRVRPMERWGLGAFAGSLHVDDQEDGSDLGLLGRYRISRAFSLELELAKTKMDSGNRVDRHIGSALLYDLAPHRSLSPYLLVGAGFGQTELGDGEFHAEQGYGEIGVGLQYRLTSSFHITADLRAGARQSQQDVAYMSTAPIADFEKEERFNRARIGALLYF